MEKCEYGCNQLANYKLKNKKGCCESTPNKCPEVKRKNKAGCLLAYEEQRKGYTYNPTSNWRDKKYNIPFEKYFCKNSNIGNSRLKQRIFDEGIREYKCESCDNTHWLKKPITLELDHINGDNKDNRLENLRLLCPNCHSQTATWRRRKTIKEDRISDEELIAAIKKTDCITNALKLLGYKNLGGGNYYRAKTLRDRLKDTKEVQALLRSNSSVRVQISYWVQQHAPVVKLANTPGLKPDAKAYEFDSRQEY